MVEELARDWVGALCSGRNSWSLVHLEDTKLGLEHRWKLGLQFLNSAREIPNFEEAVRVDWAAFINVFPAHKRQARCSQIDTGAVHDAVLDRNVFDMVLFYVRGRFDFYQAPALVSTALEYIDPHEHIPMLERTLEYRWNVWIFD